MSRMMMCAAALAVALAGCGGSKTMDRAQVEKMVQTELSKSVGQKAPAATCPGDIAAKLGTTMRCYMDFPDEGKRLGITVKVKSVDGSKGKLSIVADDKLTKTP